MTLPPPPPGQSPSQPPQYQQPYAQPFYVVPPRPSNGAAVAGLVLGLIAIIVGVWTIVPILGLAAAFFSFVPALLAVIFGASGLKRFRQTGVGRAAALTGVWTGGITLAIIILTTLWWMAQLGAV